MNICFHIGLYKTGSTYLQRSIMKGKFFTFEGVENPNDNMFSNELRRRVRDCQPEIWKATRAENIFNVLDGKRDIVISHESLIDLGVYEEIENPGSTNVCSEPDSLIAHLASIRDHAISGKVKVILFYRQQADWLASWYAHICYRLMAPSQLDFEQKVRELVSDPVLSDALCFYRMVTKFYDSLGVNNVLALPYEMLNTDFVREKLYYFASHNEFLDKENLVYRNKKRVAEDSWAVSKRAQFEGRRVLTLPEGIRALVNRRYLESNKKLADLAGLDLRRFGYY